jgi:hypothetical protein
MSPKATLGPRHNRSSALPVAVMLLTTSSLFVAQKKKGVTSMIGPAACDDRSDQRHVGQLRLDPPPSRTLLIGAATMATGAVYTAYAISRQRNARAIALTNGVVDPAAGRRPCICCAMGRVSGRRAFESIGGFGQ